MLKQISYSCVYCVFKNECIVFSFELGFVSLSKVTLLVSYSLFNGCYRIVLIVGTVYCQIDSFFPWIGFVRGQCVHWNQRIGHCNDLKLKRWTLLIYWQVHDDMNGIRGSAPDEVHIRRRNAKLLQREVTLAGARGWTKIPCPCRIHMTKAELTIA